MLKALEPSMGVGLTASFSKLLPDLPWREVVPSHHWLRSEVMEAVAVFEPRRRLVHEALIDLIGEVHAATLMEHLPPAPWRELVGRQVPLERTVLTACCPPR
jgi:hypothetical protein